MSGPYKIIKYRESRRVRTANVTTRISQTILISRRGIEIR